MPPRQRTISIPPKTARRTATTPEGREVQMISMAEKLAEQQLQDGTASAQVITHYLKLGSSREQLEQSRLKGEVELLHAKIESLESQKDIVALYKEATEAMRAYSGQSPVEDDDGQND